MAYLESGDESGALLLPVVQSGGWSDNQEGTPDALPLRREEDKTIAVTRRTEMERKVRQASKT